MSRSACGSLLIGAVLLSASCSSVDNFMTSDAPPVDSTPDVEQVAARVSVAPLLPRAADLVVQVLPQAPSCPATFDLGNGVSGTCALLDGIDDWGGAYQYWSLPAVGSVMSGGKTVETHIRMRVPVNSCEPQSWCGFHSGDSTLQWSGGSHAWRGYGSAVLDAAGLPTSLFVELITDPGTWHVSLDAFVLKDFEPLGVTARIDRGTGAGSISHGSTLLATLAVQDGCVTIDFVDPQKEVRTSCLW
jgi:hypothetical protein